ncbi:MAG: serine dehydratase beta chain [Desulfobacterales bacterium]|nr:serine dehydratase beta chain [Desulfobacterales bacterium]MDD4073376.1 serine dehydratase beta chain [Desulfobacterales bacterium]MDD4392486.1 serine dehydratase beta chain [Desulfobacterales bacterium]
MKTLRELYRIGYGPSGRHTIAPYRAATLFGREHPDAEGFRVTLYGSLAATGKGHMTDVAIQEAFYPRGVEIIWEPSAELPLHQNGMRFEAVNASGRYILPQG